MITIGFIKPQISLLSVLSLNNAVGLFILKTLACFSICCFNPPKSHRRIENRNMKVYNVQKKTVYFYLFQ